MHPLLSKSATIFKIPKYYFQAILNRLEEAEALITDVCNTEVQQTGKNK